jgi:hypothetical protein
MKAIEDFGIIVICCNQDYSFAKGVCASIRHFLGDVPICLLVDGDFSVADAQAAYGVKVINRQNMKYDLLKKRSFGWGITRMIAFWESPFKHFLILDADVAVWGDILKYQNFQDYDVIVDKPCYGYSDEAVNEYFFDTVALEKFFPDFQWLDRPFVCPAVLYGTRDIFSLEEYEKILNFLDAHPGVFKYGDMGFLNFMLFRAKDEGRLRLGQADMQFLVPDFDRQLVEQRFAMKNNLPAPQGDDATVIHWCGPKPTVFTNKTYAEPMKFFRRQFLLKTTGKSGLDAELSLLQEDLVRNTRVYSGKAKKKIKKLLIAKPKAPAQVAQPV